MQKDEFDFASLSVIGKRQEQQDAVYTSASGNTLVCALCDGMGGLSGGSAASAAAIGSFVTSFSDINSYGSMDEFFNSAIDKADETVCLLRKKSGQTLKAGTTMVAAVFSGKMMFWFSVGDSHLYFVRKNAPVLLNKEHTYVTQLNEMKKIGAITEELYQAEISKGDSLVSYIGMGGVLQKDVCGTPVAICPGDRIVAVTDGVYKAISDAEIAAVFAQPDCAQGYVERIIGAVEEKDIDGQDNASAIVVTF